MHLAVDLGASSGRLILGNPEQSFEFSRFTYDFYESDGHLFWPLQEIVQKVRTEILKAKQNHSISTVGIDSWAVDFVDLNSTVGMRCYRDPKNHEYSEKLNSLLGFDYIFSRNGLQSLPFTSVYQMYGNSLIQKTESIKPLLFPDYLNYLFTGRQFAEISNASTTGLVNPNTRNWDTELIAKLPFQLDLPELIEPGTIIGPGIGELSEVMFVSVASHDTASAFVGAELSANEALISIGTWSLIGAQIETPNLSKSALDNGFTNELGYPNNVRFLKNSNGMWVVEQLKKAWDVSSEEMHQMIASTKFVPAQPIVDINHPDLLGVGNPEDVLNNLYGDKADRVIILRRVMDSLAASYISIVDQLEITLNQKFDTLKLVGGGSNNSALVEILSDITDKKITVGNSETTALGNLRIQQLALAASL